MDTWPAMLRENVDVVRGLPNRASTATTVPLWFRGGLTGGGKLGLASRAPRARGREVVAAQSGYPAGMTSSQSGELPHRASVL